MSSHQLPHNPLELCIPSLLMVRMMGLNAILGTLEREMIEMAVSNSPTFAAAARSLKIPRSTLFMKMRKLGIKAGVKC